jgi:signal transduction histidine kinase
VLEALNKSNDDNYTGNDVAVLETLASLAAACMANAAMQKRAQATYEEMAELERMKNDFIAITSHELRTPLGLILGHSTFLRELAEEKHREQLDTIIRNATRLKDIVENLSNVDNFQNGAARLRRKMFSMTGLIADVSASLLPAARGKEIDFRIDVEDDELMVDGDAEKVGIALTNLAKNAIDYTDAGGHVIVTAQKIPGYVKVAVIDDGIGIPAKDLPHIFERFYQVESHLTRRHGGMGLGLSAAKAMVEMHGGRIWAESVEGKGSIFTFLLLLDAESRPPAEGPFTTAI